MPAALDRSYDGIIIGAGHHGLVLGSYLARCGLDILLVDRRLQYGGATSTWRYTSRTTPRTVGLHVTAARPAKRETDQLCCL